MEQQTHSHAQSDAANRIIRQHAFSALLMVVGFVFFEGPDLQADWVITDFSVAVVVLTFRGGGLLMLAVALLCLVGWRKALLADAIVSLVIGVLFTLSGLSLVLGGSFLGALVIIFGLMDLNSARANWMHHLSLTRSALTTAVFDEDAPRNDEAAADVMRPEQAAAARERALQRVLESKKARLRPEPPPARPRPEPEPEPDFFLPDLSGPEEPDQAPIPIETGEERAKPAPAEEPTPAEVPAPPSPPESHAEPAPDGFLAELGREDRNKGKPSPP